MPRFFTRDHEWLDLDGDEALIGITDFAQARLGDIVFVDLPAAGAALRCGGEAASVESVKAASDIYAPVDGVVIRSNPALDEDPGLVNRKAEDHSEGGGWFFRMTVSDQSQTSALMDTAAYRAFCADL